MSETLFKVDLRFHVMKDAVLVAARRQQPGDPTGADARKVGFFAGEAPSAQQDATSKAADKRIGGPQLL
jgi:hypothetical protein